MKSLKNSLPKQGNLSDKTFVNNIVVCVLSMLICLISLSSVTWAWFGDTTSSGSNIISTATYNIEITVKKEDSEEVEHLDANGSYQFEANQSYTVTMKSTENSTATTGYCKVYLPSSSTAEDKKVAYTEQIFTTISQKSPTSITFTIQFDVDSTVTFEPCWGTYAVSVRTFYNDKEYSVKDGNVAEQTSGS